MAKAWRVRRRGIIALTAVVMAAVAGCGDDEPARAGSDGETTGSPPASGGETRTVDTEFGPVEVPAAPQRVVALDEYAALNALAVGVEPTLVFAAYQSEVGGVVLDDAGIEVQPATAEAGPNFEAVAAAEPDLIVFTTEAALGSHHEQLSAIAPSVSLPYTTPWREVIEATAELFGREDVGERLIDMIEDRIEPLRSRVEGDPRSISILGDSLGMVFAASMTSPLSQVVEEVGFARPEAETDGTPDATYESAVPLSLERLEDHDADIVAVLSGAYYNAATLTEAPTFQALPAVADGRSVTVDGDMWFGAYPFAIFWLLEDLEALHTGDGQQSVGTLDDVAGRWAEFEELLP
jgi:iron complex transport system substrate-binding protein